MFQWCAYCQKLIGETESFKVLDFTHGICSSCLKEDRWSSASADQVRKLAQYHRELIEIGRTGDLSLAPEALQKGLALGVRPLDFLIGLIQPALYEIGSQWECGTITIAEEHRFTAFASRLIDLCYQAIPPSEYQQSNQPDIVLTNAPNNYHFLGLRIIEQWLISANLRVFTVYPGIPTDEIVKLATSLKPKYLGISIAVVDQAAFLSELIDRLEKASFVSKNRPILLVGGPALRSSDWKPIEPEKVVYCKEISQLNKILELGRHSVELKKGA